MKHPQTIMQQAIEKARETQASKAISTPVQPVVTAKLLDSLPGLVGAIDKALFDTCGERVAFVLVAFAAGGAVHATNIQPAANAVKALKDLTANWDTGDGDVAG